MNIYIHKFNIRTACFLAAFAAVGAGFAYKANLLQSSLDESKTAYDRLTLSESAENLEKLEESLERLISASEKEHASCLADIRLYSELLRSASGHLDFENTGGEELFSYLSCVSLLAENALKLGISEKEQSAVDNEFARESAPPMTVFSMLAHYAEEITEDALPLLAADQSGFEGKIAEIFSDTGIETILYENGYGALAPENGFKTIGGEIIKESDAKELARRYIGKKAYLTAELSDGDFPSYHLGGSNISAVISAKSGILMQFLFDLPEGESKIDEPTAAERANAFIGEMGFDISHMSISPPIDSEGLYIFEYIPVSKNNVLCLNEKILVGVSRGSGRICLYDAMDYYKYHMKNLALPPNMLTPEEISARYGLEAPPTLCKIERCPGIESLCYGFENSGVQTFISALSGMRIDT